jgi:hypothetical protein
MPMIEEDVLRRTARILGDFSAAGKALEDIQRRRNLGEDPVCVSYGDSLLVFNAADLGDA